MKTLANTIKWDLLIQNKYQIINVLFAVTGLYLLLFWLVPALRFDELLILLVFFDPSMLGLTFIGALVLFEKGDHTLDALVVTPIKLWQYLWSKAISLTIMAVISGILIAGMGHGWGSIRYEWFLPGLAMTSLLYALMGLGLVAGVQTLNGYLIKVALCTIPLALPLLNLFGVMDTYIWYFIPSQASISVFEAAFGREIPLWELLYGFAYMGIWIYGMYRWALMSFQKHVLR